MRRGASVIFRSGPSDWGVGLVVDAVLRGFSRWEDCCPELLYCRVAEPALQEWVSYMIQRTDQL